MSIGSESGLPFDKWNREIPDTIPDINTLERDVAKQIILGDIEGRYLSESEAKLVARALTLIDYIYFIDSSEGE